jgi:hypothetical protein
MTKATNTSSLTPWIRLYDRSGNLLNSFAGTSTAEVNTTAPTNGLYTVVLGDDSGGFGGSGGYIFTVNGLNGDLKLCDPVISGTNIDISGVGGATNGAFQILTSTNVATPLALWTPILTNQFDTFGTFTASNFFNPAQDQLYFIILEP